MKELLIVTDGRYHENVVTAYRRRENELDFFDQELLMMNRCRNSIDKIGRNFHYIIVNDQTRVLDKDGFYQDAERLTTEIFNLKNQFENYIMLCKGELFQIKWRCDYGRLR